VTLTYAIPALIDKYDTCETIRDQIAGILAVESARQQVLATAAGKSSALWKLNVYTERSNAFDQWLLSQTDRTPIVNVVFDSASFDATASNAHERQKADGVFHVDVFGLGVAANKSAGGHTLGDEAAALEAQRAARLVRNILMAAPYMYLGLRGTVWRRWISSVTLYQPSRSDNAIQQVCAARIALEVQYNEFSPQYTAVDLEDLLIKIKRAEDGAVVLVEAEYDSTPTP